MAHEIETMAFANAVPWHGLGNQVDPSVSVDEMLVAAGLDWEIQKKPLFTIADGQSIEIPGRRALVRSSDNKFFGISGDFWKPFQNKQVMEFFRDYTEQGGAKLETAGSLRGGKLVWALASVGEGFTVNRDDHSKGYILLTSSHEVGRANTVRTTLVRVVCANTMAMATRGNDAQYSQNHLEEFDILAAKEAIGLAREEVIKAGIDARILSQMQMSEYDTVRFLAKFFQPKPEEINENEFVNGLLDQSISCDKNLDAVLFSVNKAPGAFPGTAWGVLNGVTHWADHVAGYKADSRMFSSWFGDKAKLKLEVNRELIEMAA
jgi:phage/plasmid-like protein (TIGR03299 family)